MCLAKCTSWSISLHISLPPLFTLIINYIKIRGNFLQISSSLKNQLLDSNLFIFSILHFKTFYSYLNLNSSKFPFPRLYQFLKTSQLYKYIFSSFQRFCFHSNFSTFFKTIVAHYSKPYSPAKFLFHLGSKRNLFKYPS